VVPGILRLAREARPVHLAVSLHAATQAERAALVPAARKWPLDELMAACRTYSETTGRRIFYEWTLIAGKNDTPATPAPSAPCCAACRHSAGEPDPVESNPRIRRRAHPPRGGPAVPIHPRRRVRPALHGAAAARDRYRRRLRPARRRRKRASGDPDRGAARSQARAAALAINPP
jgi:hypothetical protein